MNCDYSSSELAVGGRRGSSVNNLANQYKNNSKWSEGINAPNDAIQRLEIMGSEILDVFNYTVLNGDVIISNDVCLGTCCQKDTTALVSGANWHSPTIGVIPDLEPDVNSWSKSNPRALTALYENGADGKDVCDSKISTNEVHTSTDDENNGENNANDPEVTLNNHSPYNSGFIAYSKVKKYMSSESAMMQGTIAPIVSSTNLGAKISPSLSQLSGQSSNLSPRSEVTSSDTSLSNDSAAGAAALAVGESSTSTRKKKAMLVDVYGNLVDRDNIPLDYLSFDSTHFRPIETYVDGHTFDINCALDSVSYMRTRSGYLCLNSTKYQEYNGNNNDAYIGDDDAMLIMGNRAPSSSNINSLLVEIDDSTLAVIATSATSTKTTVTATRSNCLNNDSACLSISMRGEQITCVGDNSFDHRSEFVTKFCVKSDCHKSCQTEVQEEPLNLANVDRIKDIDINMDKMQSASNILTTVDVPAFSNVFSVSSKVNNEVVKGVVECAGMAARAMAGNRLNAGHYPRISNDSMNNNGGSNDINNTNQTKNEQNQRGELQQKQQTTGFNIRPTSSWNTSAINLRDNFNLWQFGNNEERCIWQQQDTNNGNDEEKSQNEKKDKNAITQRNSDNTIVRVEYRTPEELIKSIVENQQVSIDDLRWHHRDLSNIWRNDDHIHDEGNSLHNTSDDNNYNYHHEHEMGEVHHVKEEVYAVGEGNSEGDGNDEDEEYDENEEYDEDDDEEVYDGEYHIVEVSTNRSDVSGSNVYRDNDDDLENDVENGEEYSDDGSGDDDYEEEYQDAYDEEVAAVEEVDAYDGSYDLQGLNAPPSGYVINDDDDDDEYYDGDDIEDDEDYEDENNIEENYHNWSDYNESEGSDDDNDTEEDENEDDETYEGEGNYTNEDIEDEENNAEMNRIVNRNFANQQGVANTETAYGIDSGQYYRHISPSRNTNRDNRKRRHSEPRIVYHEPRRDSDDSSSSNYSDINYDDEEEETEEGTTNSVNELHNLDVSDLESLCDFMPLAHSTDDEDEGEKEGDQRIQDPDDVEEHFQHYQLQSQEHKQQEQLHFEQQQHQPLQQQQFLEESQFAEEEEQEMRVLTSSFWSTGGDGPAATLDQAAAAAILLLAGSGVQRNTNSQYRHPGAEEFGITAQMPAQYLERQQQQFYFQAPYQPPFQPQQYYGQQQMNMGNNYDNGFSSAAQPGSAAWAQARTTGIIFSGYQHQPQQHQHMQFGHHQNYLPPQPQYLPHHMQQNYNHFQVANTHNCYADTNGVALQQHMNLFTRPLTR